MTKEKKLQIHNITYKKALCYCSEFWITQLYNNDTQKMEYVSRDHY
jgi:hypothetical protein